MQVRYQVELLPSPQLQRHAQVKQTVSNIILREALRNMIDFNFLLYESIDRVICSQFSKKRPS